MSARGAHAGNHGRGSHWIRDGKRKLIYERDQWRCVWCAHEVQSGATSRQDKADRWVNGVRLATLDHVLPRSLGGCNSAHNLVTACSTCNEQRGDSSAIAFAWQLATAASAEAIGKPIGPSAFRSNWIANYAGRILDRVIEAMGKQLEKPAKQRKAA